MLNAANEECVAAFAAGALPFLGIVDTVARVVEEHDGGASASGDRNTPTLADVLAAEQWARIRAREMAGMAGRGGTSA